MGTLAIFYTRAPACRQQGLSRISLTLQCVGCVADMYGNDVADGHRGDKDDKDAGNNGGDGGRRLTELLFRCESVRHRFVLGHNPTMETWEPADDQAFAPAAARKQRKKRGGGGGDGGESRAPMLEHWDPGREYTLENKLSDIASIMGGLDMLTQKLNKNGV